MNSNDPRPTPPSQADMMLQIAQLLADTREKSSQGADVSTALEQMTKTLAELTTRTMPENRRSTGISAFSHPEGDYVKPKAPLKCAMNWVGYPLTLETLRPDEVEALNQLEPGDYRVTKANLNTIPFVVAPKRTQNGALESLSIYFPCKGDQASDHRSMIDYCMEAMGRAVPTLEQLSAELAKVKAELAAKVAA